MHYLDAKNSSFHHEIGPIDHSNTKLINQYKLSQTFPEIFPRIILPKQEELKRLRPDWNFPVQKIDGIRWCDVTERVHSHMMILKIAIVILEQVQEVLQKTGVLICDRNGRNTLIQYTESNSDFRVYQVDLEQVYDAVKDKHFLDSKLHLSDRKEIHITNQKEFNARVYLQLSLLMHNLVVNLIQLPEKPSIKEIDVQIYLQDIQKKVDFYLESNFAGDGWEILISTIEELKKAEAYLANPEAEVLVEI